MLYRKALANLLNPSHQLPLISSICMVHTSKFSLKKSSETRRQRIEPPIRIFPRYIHVFKSLDQKKSGKDIVPMDFFVDIQNKNKETYLDMIRIYDSRDVHKRGHVEFIYAALKHMEEFGVHKDLQVYKSLIDVLPKGKFIPTNVFQAEFQHYPKQQQCAIDLLEKMEDNGVMPDKEMENILMNVFGSRGHPVRKFWRMMYWMPKFKNLSPWPVPNPVPEDPLELARLAIERISSVDLQRRIEVFQASELEDALDSTWIVSAQSPKQQELLEKHPLDKPVFVEGYFRVWMRGAAVNYFILRADPSQKKEVPPEDPDDVTNLKSPFEESDLTCELTEKCIHEQEEGTILALAATGTSSRDSLLSWIRFLQKSNPALGKIPVLFTLSSPCGEVVPVVDAQEQKTISHTS